MAVAAEKFVVDNKGRPVAVLLSMPRYRKLLAALEELEDIRDYDRAKKRKDNDKVVPLDKAFEQIERSRK